MSSSTGAQTVTVEEDRLAALERRVNQLENENEELRERVHDLEEKAAENERKANAARETAFELEDAVTGDEGSWVAQKLAEERGSILDRVHDIETDNIEPGDILDLDGSDNDLPIQRKTAERKTGAHDLSNNKERATYVWPEFNNRAQSSNGQLILASWQVRNILDENDLDTNPATVRRVMEFVAELTSTKPEDERDPEDEDNLVTLRRGEGENTLRADKDEWREFFEEQMDAAVSATGGSEVMQ